MATPSNAHYKTVGGHPTWRVFFDSGTIRRPYVKPSKLLAWNSDPPQSPATKPPSRAKILRARNWRRRLRRNLRRKGLEVDSVR